MIRIITTSWREATSVITTATIVESTTTSILKSSSVLGIIVVELGIGIVVELRTSVGCHSHDCVLF